MRQFSLKNNAAASSAIKRRGARLEKFHEAGRLLIGHLAFHLRQPQQSAGRLFLIALILRILVFRRFSSTIR